MKPIATPAQIAKLPQWAQSHIEDLSRERDIAIRALNKYVDGQTESSVFIDELESLGEQRTDTTNSPSFKRRYIQTKRVSFEWKGIDLDVYLEDGGIALSWGTLRRTMGEVALVPQSFQKVMLKMVEDLRR